MLFSRGPVVGCRRSLAGSYQTKNFQRNCLIILAKGLVVFQDRPKHFANRGDLDRELFVLIKRK